MPEPVPPLDPAATEKLKVMVVHGKQTTREFLQEFLRERGYRAVVLQSGEELVNQFHVDEPMAVMMDLLAPGPFDSLQALTELKKIDREIPIILLSADGPDGQGVRAMRLGAADVIYEPFETADLDAALSSALQQRNGRLAVPLDSPLIGSRRQLLLGTSSAMVEVRTLIAQVADTDVTVLIRGESGTGKELTARALHAASLRRDQPFVKVNCAALPTDLLESELFGCERGAFTGALHARPGKFEFAHRGTIFLDEIGEISRGAQAKLLQVLQDGEFSRLGGRHDIRVDVRIVSATNRDLEGAVENGHFREDLFFRLNVVSIQMPPLRARRDEIAALTNHFLDKYSRQYNRPRIELGPATMSFFMQYDWPGNVRELENAVKRAVVLGGDGRIYRELANGMANPGLRTAPVERPEPIPDPPLPKTGRQSPAALAAAAADRGQYSLKDISRTAAREAERELIFRILEQTRWNRKATAAILGISYKALLYKIKDSGLDQAS